MATKTQKLRIALIADGYSSTISKSDRECFHKLRNYKDGITRDHYVWLFSGTLRGGFSKNIGDSISLPVMVSRLLREGNFALLP